MEIYLMDMVCIIGIGQTYSCYLEANNMRTDGENESSLPQGQHKQHSQHKRINRNSRPPLRNSGNQTPGSSTVCELIIFQTKMKSSSYML
jgi:hypothetical protein